MKRLYNRINRAILKKVVEESSIQRRTLSFYRYAHIQDPLQFRDTLYQQLEERGVLGRIYIAPEGINGQISIPKDQITDFQTYISSIPILNDLRLNYAIEDDTTSFFKLIIKVRQKIVADGLNDDTFDVTDRGVHLDAQNFNQLTNQDETIIVDMRNHYESEVGHFENAICPDVETFREALPKVVEMLSDKKDQPIVMYCTGGIRCEKASAFLKHKGFKDVYQLDGGIIEYARQVEAQGLENKFKGKNFVFDERLGERISEEVISHCHQCGDACDTHTNCANDACHMLFIQCSTCAEKYAACCSNKCADFIKLPQEEQKEKRKTEVFNGTKFGKGRYKANNSNAPVISST
jgi:UPF0176 protein